MLAGQGEVCGGAAAAELQRQLVEGARAAGNQALAAHLERNLARYSAGQSCDPGMLGMGR